MAVPPLLLPAEHTNGRPIVWRPLHLLNLCYLLMTRTIVYAAALIAALITVVGSRFVVPAAILIFKAIEESFAPVEPELAVAALPVAVSEPIEQRPTESTNQTNSDKAAAPRKARRRKPSAKALAAIEAIA